MRRRTESSKVPLNQWLFKSLIESLDLFIAAWTLLWVHGWFHILDVKRPLRGRFVLHLSVLVIIYVSHGRNHEIRSILILTPVSFLRTRRVPFIELLITWIPRYVIGLLGRNFEVRNSYPVHSSLVRENRRTPLTLFSILLSRPRHLI